MTLDPSANSSARLHPGATAVIFDSRGRLLLQKRGDNGRWGLPGGAVEVGESVAAACVREVKEETGYDVEVVRLVGVYSDPDWTTIRYADGNVFQFVTTLFECRVVGGEPTLCEETTALDWADPRQLPEPFLPNHVQRVRDALERRAEAFFR
jgi:8-oxo-dGTP pyrophosphatase MutT (NUDIX family)